MFKYLTIAALLVLAGIANAGTVTALGYTFDDTNPNTLTGLINEKVGGVPDGPGALDVITANGVTLFDIDGSNPGNVDASVLGFVDTNDGGATWFEIASPTRMDFIVSDDVEWLPSAIDGLTFPDNLLMTGSLTATGPDSYLFTIDGGVLFDGVGGFRFTTGSLTLTGSGGEGDTFSMTMTASPVPVPAAVWLFGSVVGFTFLSRRKA